MKNYFLMALMVTACIGLTGCGPSDEEKSVAELQSEVNELADKAIEAAQAEIAKADATKDYAACEKVKADAASVKVQAGTATDENKQPALEAKETAEGLSENADDCATDKQATASGGAGAGSGSTPETTKAVGVVTYFHSGPSPKAGSTEECPANVTSFYGGSAGTCSKSADCVNQANTWKTKLESDGWTCAETETARTGLAVCPPVKDVTWTCTKS